MLYHTNNGRRQGRGLSLLLGCLLFVVALRCEAQNLVPNPSMEENSACPIALGFQGFSKPLHWEKWNQTPEYFHECAGSLGGVDTLIGVPQNGFGFQYAYHGQAYVGMYSYWPSTGGGSFREYVGCQLIQPLVVGETYYLSFWTNVAGGVGAGGSYSWTRHASNNMGMLFTMDHNIWTGNSGPPFAIRNYAHLHSEEIIDDPEEWVNVSGMFIADSAYQYLVLGNFFSNALTDTVAVVPGGSLGAYYFVDGVCVTTDPEGCDFTTGSRQNFKRETHFYPNPATDFINIQFDEADIHWVVLDMWGREITSGSIDSDKVQKSVVDWPIGNYILLIQGKEGIRRSKFMVVH